MDLNPNLEQIAVFLSKTSDPLGEICGVSVMKLDQSGVINDEFLIGFHKTFEEKLNLAISDDYPAAVALRTNKLQIADLTKGGTQYSDLPTVKRVSDYRCGVILPVSESRVFGIAFSSSIEEVEKHKDYLEVIRIVLAQYLGRQKFESKTSSHLRHQGSSSLTPRQSTIVEMIKEGRTNNSIAAILGYSESLIRQETIIIYRKLGIEGRRDILRESNVEEHSE